MDAISLHPSIFCFAVYPAALRVSVLVVFMFLTDRKVTKASQAVVESYWPFLEHSCQHFLIKVHLIYICGVTAAAELHLADVGFSSLLAGK